MHRPDARCFGLNGLPLTGVPRPGCAALSEDEGRITDWFESGEQHGRKGRSRARLHAHEGVCPVEIEPRLPRDCHEGNAVHKIDAHPWPGDLRISLYRSLRALDREPIHREQ